MTKVAFIQDQGDTSTTRKYIAMDKTGKVVFETQVYDCGHGAQIAHERAVAAGFQPTTAKWAMDLIHKFHKAKLVW